MEYTVKDVWLAPAILGEGREEMTFALVNEQGQRRYVVVAIDRMTELLAAESESPDAQ